MVYLDMKIAAVDDNGNIIVEFPLGNGLGPQVLGMLAEVRVWQYLDSIGVESKIVSLQGPIAKGVDIILSDGTTIEVKAAKMSYNNKRASETFAFGARKTTADFIIVWAVDYDDFYIIPNNFISSGVNRIYPSAARWQYVRNNWELLQS